MPNRRNFIKALSAAGILSSTLDIPLFEQGASESFIECYTGQMSIAPGQTLDFHVSTNCQRYAISITRIGAQPIVVWHRDGLPGVAHAVPEDASMIGCGWPVALTIDVPESWRSGIYSIELVGDRNRKAVKKESFFIVRPAYPGKDADILFQVSTNTYQAYNAWGGSTLYSGPDFPRVSYDRPFSIFEQRFFMEGVGESVNPNTNCHHTWDEPFIIWAERAGYKIDYCANLDLELHPELLRSYKLVLSVGHDEYWSWGMRDALEGFVEDGGNAAFFSGNTCCWQIRVEDQGRSIVCHKKNHEHDPVFQTNDSSRLTTLWSHPLTGRPENEMTGVGYPYGGYNGFFNQYETGPDAGTYIVHRPDHWVFANTGLRQGERFGKLKMGEQPGIVGYECDGCEFVMESGLPIPTGRDGTPKNMLILATGKARWAEVDSSIKFAQDLRSQLPPPEPGQAIPSDPIHASGSSVLGLFEREGGGTVLTVGSTHWSSALAEDDHVAQQIVRNILDRLSE
jgi:hypothetical protein